MLQLYGIVITFVAAIPIRKAASVFGAGTGPIFVDHLDCDSDEISLLGCPHDVIHQCDHSDDAGAQCFGACEIS